MKSACKLIGREFKRQRSKKIAPDEEMKLLTENKLTENDSTPHNQGKGEMDDVIKMVDEYDIPLEKKRVDERETDTSKTGAPKGKIREQIFNKENRKELSHNEILEYEYKYNSEEEFGLEDAFEKTRVIKRDSEVKKKLRHINVIPDDTNL